LNYVISLPLVPNQEPQLAKYPDTTLW